MNRKLFAASVALAAAASPASAATLVTQLGSTAAYAAPAGTVIDFDSALPAGFTYTPSNASIVSGDLVDSYAAPAFGPAGTAYLAVLQGGFASFAGTTAYDSVSFFLGSIDAHNVVEVLSTTGAVIARYTGQAFTANANGNQDLPGTNRRVTVTRGATDASIGGVRFVSNGNSLEVDNVVFAVPEPSTWAMMFLGFGMIGTAARYRRRSKSVTYA